MINIEKSTNYSIYEYILKSVSSIVLATADTREETLRLFEKSLIDTRAKCVENIAIIDAKLEEVRNSK